MRIYLYITSQFVTPSTYLQDGISVQSNWNISILNYLGQEIVEAGKYVRSFSQIQPLPSDGSSPLAANKWYMLQYELAYDPILLALPYSSVQLSWHLNYCNVQTVDLGGTQQGSLRGTIGEGRKGGASEGIFSGFKELGEGAGKGVLSGIGLNFITNNTINEKTGDNRLGLKPSVFKSITTGLKSALSGSISSLPQLFFNGLNAVFGSKGTKPIPINLQFESNIKLSGSITEKGSFPSSPTSFWIPGTRFTSNTPGYIPLYNYPLGVICFNGCPQLNTTVEYEAFGEEDPYDGSIHRAYNIYSVFPKSFNFSQYLIINPAVKEIADIKILKQDLICDHFSREFNPDKILIGVEGSNYGTSYPANWELNLSVRFTIEVIPKNGDNPSVIIKTFRIKEKRIDNNKNI